MRTERKIRVPSVPFPFVLEGSLITFGRPIRWSPVSMLCEHSETKQIVWLRSRQQVENFLASAQFGK